MTDPNQPIRQRLRLTFAKKQPIKYIAHLDLALAWERALRRARIPMAYSQGFNPRPKMQFASGLPLGSTGQAELLDIVVSRPLDPADVLEAIRPKLPAGIVLHTVEEIPVKAPATQQLVREAEYRVTVETDRAANDLNQRIAALLAAEEIITARKRKKRIENINIRPWIHELRIESIAAGDVVFYMRLTAGQFGNLRPEHVLEALGLGENWASYDRTRLIMDDVPDDESAYEFEPEAEDA